MQFHILNENYTPIAVMDNDLPDAINFNNSKFHRFLTGSADFFDFETSKLHVDHNQFQVGYWLAFRYDDRDRLQYINEISEAESDKMMSISTLSNNLDLNQEKTQPFSADIARPFSWYFDRIMIDAGYEIGINEISNLTRKLSWDSEMSHRAFLQSVATQFDNVELDYEVILNSDFTIKKRLVHIKKQIGEVRDDIELRYGKNIKTVKRSTNIDNLYTAIRPISKDDNGKITNISSMPDWQKLDKNGNVVLFHKKGTHYIYAPQANARFGNRGSGVIYGGYVVYDYSYDKVSQSDLFNRSVTKLEEISVPAVNYEVEGRTGAKIGDTVKIVDDGYTPQLILSARVLEQVVSFDDATVEQATFGNYKAFQSQISAELISKMQQLADENEPYKAVTLTTNGLTFKNSEGSTTLTARLYKGTKEIAPESYEWTINGVSIPGYGEQQEITADDINGKAVVRWSAVINGVTVAFDEVTITDVSDGANGVSPTVTINPDTSLTIVDFKGTKKTPVLKGSDGADGKDGLAGKDGVGVKNTVVTYSISTSGTTAPSSGWTSSVPSLVKGKYLWTKTVWTYTDNSSETGYSVTYISKDGNNGTDGIAGKDGVGISNTIIEYVGAASGTSKPTSGWSATIPTVPSGQYLWTRTTWQYTDGTSEQGFTNALMGREGASGKDGVAGKNGVGIKSTQIMYAQSTSVTTPPTTGWTAQVPTLIKGQYLWTQTTWVYTDNTGESGYTVSYNAKDGNNGTDGIAGKDGVGIKATTITYASHTNGTTTPTTGYTTAVPSVPAGQFLWTKTVWTYTDNTSETGYSVAMMGLKGDKGDSGNNGTNGLAGKDGKGIKATAITYQASTNGITAPTGTWSAGVPAVANGSFLWTRTIWTYTDNTTETGYAIAYMGTNGNNGTNGVAGKDGVGIKTTTITYVGSTNGTTTPTSGWASTVPTVAAGSYLWTKTVWTYTDNTSETGYSVARMGKNGGTGPQGEKGDPTGVTKSATEPQNKFVGMIWYVDSNTDVSSPNMEVGTVAQSHGQYTWTGTKWSLLMLRSVNVMVDNGFIKNAMIADASIESAKIKNLNADKIIASSLSAISANLGAITSAVIKVMADVIVNATNATKKFGMLFTKKGLLSTGPSYNPTGVISDTKMSVASLNQGELRFIDTTYNQDLEAVQNNGMSSPNYGYIRFTSNTDGDVLEITSSGKIILNGETSQPTPWTMLTNFSSYKVIFGRVNIKVSLTSGSSRKNIYLGTVPDQYKSPNGDMMLPAQAWFIGTNLDRHVQYNADGSLHLLNPEPNTKYVFEVSYTL